LIHVVDGWGSHLPLLLAAFEATHGPVLEFGVGHCSTPLLHALCHATKRPLLSLESHPVWHDQFAGLETAEHEVRLVKDWLGWEVAYTEQAWGLVFIDESPTEHRVEVLAKVAGSTVAVIHDAERKDGGLMPAIRAFPHHFFYKPRARQPWSAVVSRSPLPLTERHVRVS
jgi:hypothetical protein